MKCTSIILGALAAVATAAPTTKVVTRGNRDFSNFGDFSGINNFDFFNDDLQYLSLFNSLDFGVLAQLSAVNNLDVFQFGNVFSNNVFDVAAVLQFQQISQLVQLGQLGAFNQLDLSGLLFNQLNFGLIQDDVFNFNLGGQINAAIIPQVLAVVQSGGVLPAFSGAGLSSGFSSSSFSSSGVSNVPVSSVSSSSLSGAQQPEINAAPGSFVTADEFNAQEGGASLPKL